MSENNDNNEKVFWVLGGHNEYVIRASVHVGDAYFGRKGVWGFELSQYERKAKDLFPCEFDSFTLAYRSDTGWITLEAQLRTDDDDIAETVGEKLKSAGFKFVEKNPWKDDGEKSEQVAKES